MTQYKFLIWVLLSIGGLQAYASEYPKSNTEKKEFRFFINSDPQMGEKDTRNGGLRVLNDLLTDFVGEVNAKHEKSAVDFVVYNGDLVHKVKQQAFDNFAEIVSKQTPPVMLVHGNHDGHSNDQNFSRIQDKLSGYQKLNYSFDYGDWHFVVIGAQEKYVSKKQKEIQLDWLKSDLKKNANKKVMLFMHYHIMPVGLSQMEFYSYWPDTFKHQMLDIITKHNNVKYVFSGHVHSGIKGSIKSSLEYKGTKFIVCPTPVMGRPFGEEMAVYEAKPRDRYFRRGFYLEVVVKGDDVNLIGHKIKHQESVQYPDRFKQFKQEDDPRFFVSESKLLPGTATKFNFGEKEPNWFRSYRYHKDEGSAFKNQFIDGQNHLNLTAPWGSWTFDEYMETYIPVSFNQEKDNIVHYKLETPKFDKRGAGGYLRIFLYSDTKRKNKQILLYWGAKVVKQKFTYQSLFYHATGNRINPMYINNKINTNQVYLKKLTFDEASKEQDVQINVNQILQHLNNGKGMTPSELSAYSHMVIGHGVWVNLNRRGTPFKSDLVVKEVDMKLTETTSALLLNGEPLSVSGFDKKNPFHQY